MEARASGAGLRSIGNKMIAVLVAVAVLPAVTVSIYALRRASDVLSKHELTLTSEACVTDARRVEDLLDGVQQALSVLAREDSDLRRLLKELPKPQQSGEVSALDEQRWNDVARDLRSVDETLSALLEDQPTCVLAYVVSTAFQGPEGAPVLRRDRTEGRALLRLDPDRYLRADAAAVDPEIDSVLDDARNEHPERDVLRASVPGPGGDRGEAFEVFAARVQTGGWVVLVHSWRSILERLLAQEMPAETDRGVATLFRADGLAPVASSRRGASVELPERFDLRRHAQAGHANAALFENGQVVAIAPLLPRREDPSDRYVLAVERPARELLESVRGFRRVFAEVLAAALLLAALIGIWFARRLTRPLRVLRDGAIRVGRGDLSQELDVPTGDEVEELAREFNAMASQLKSLYEGMEQTIRERTEQLQGALDELRRAHVQIVESEKRYSDIVENASDLIQVTDAEGRIVSANRRQAELLETTAEALRGRRFLEFVAPEMRDATRRAFESVLAGGTLQAFESALAVDAHKGSIPIEISATPVLAGGRPVGVRAILRDVSERKAFEARLIKAERLSSIGSLAAGVAHEINNPMGIINLFAQRTLERARKGEIDVGKLEKILEQGRRVAGITRNLLDFARAAPTRFAPFSIAEAIQNTVALVADRARTAGIEVAQEVAPGLPRVMGSSQQISQVLLNLLLNAFQAIGRGGRVVVRAAVVETRRLPAAGRALRVTVEDSGPGIPADVLPRLFEPFFTTKAPGEGTGLGLSVSYGILKEHHGAIFAENRPEGGARFEFELPLDAGPAASSETKSPIAARRD
jgi:PAS domain S-box-containing protein